MHPRHGWLAESTVEQSWQQCGLCGQEEQLQWSPNPHSSQAIQQPRSTHFEVVAPPIKRGILRLWRSISLATWIISSREGVIRPDNPIISVKVLYRLIATLWQLLCMQLTKVLKHPAISCYWLIDLAMYMLIKICLPIISETSKYTLTHWQTMKKCTLYTYCTLRTLQQAHTLYINVCHTYSTYIHTYVCRLIVFTSAVYAQCKTTNWLSQSGLLRWSSHRESSLRGPPLWSCCTPAQLRQCSYRCHGRLPSLLPGR